MQILKNDIYKPYSANFRSTYPVVHWVAEMNGSYAPISNLKLAKKLQSKIVRILNKPLDESAKEMIITEQNLRAYIGRCDVNYRTNAKVRSFYNREEGGINGNTPVAYLISGNDIEDFENKLAKNIGTAKKDAKKILESAYSPDAIAAIKLYNSSGLQYVNENAKRIKNNKGMTYVLHTKFQIVRNKLGKIKDYKYLDARFLPEYGPESPFEKLKTC